MALCSPFKKRHITRIASLVVVCAITITAGVRENLLSLSGGKRVKAVWANDKKIQGLDTDGGFTDIHEMGDYVGRPFVTRDGKRVVFCSGFNKSHVSDFGDVHKVHIVDWDGSGFRTIASNGYLCQLWTDANNDDWAIWMNSNRQDFYRMNLTRNGSAEKFFRSSKSGRGDLQLSRDGTHAAVSYGGTRLVTVPGDDLVCDRGGCRASIAPDNSLYWSHFESTAHTHIELRKGCKQIANISLDGASYFPRWTGMPDVFGWVGGSKSGPGPKLILAQFNSSFTGWSKKFVLHQDNNGRLSCAWARIISGSSDPQPPALAYITISPETLTLRTGDTQQFEATAYDRNGNELSSQPAFAWTASGAGSISESGFFTAGDSKGTAMVTVSAADEEATATVTVNEPSTALRRPNAPVETATNTRRGGHLSIPLSMSKRTPSLHLPDGSLAAKATCRGAYWTIATRFLPAGMYIVSTDNRSESINVGTCR